NAGTAIPGTYTLTVTGTGTSATHTAGVTLTVTPTTATTPIVFSSLDGGRYRIFKMMSAGTGLTTLSNGNQEDIEPALSPDKTKIAFSRGIGILGLDICVMSINGGAVTRLTSDSLINGSPTWSPDGSKIAFHTWRYFTLPTLNNGEIAVMNANGSGLTRLT